MRLLRFLAGSLALCGLPGFAQTIDPIDGPPPNTQIVNLLDGPVSVVIQFGLPQGAGKSMSAAQPVDPSAAVAGTPGLAFYTTDYTSLGGKQLALNIVGTNPALGANTTTIPTVLVPLKFVFPNPGNPTLDGTNIVTATENSPIFLTADYKAGSVDLGTTQYGDALQRAEFWNLPGFSPNYHVLLGAPIVAATVSVNVPAGKGNAYLLAGGGFMGVLDDAFFEQLLATLVPLYTANQLPIFLTDNVYLGTNGLLQNCCILGFHASDARPIANSKTWIYAAYEEPGTFGTPVADPLSDVEALSHEVAEWLNDPFVGVFPGINFIPPAILPGQGGACIVNFETGDPLESAPYIFTKTTNSTVYHLQDEVTLPWYLHTSPSFSANGWYTFQNVSAAIPLLINSPASIAGAYTNTATLSFAPVNTAVTANIAYVGRGCPASPGSPADPYLTNPSGMIALIDRGSCAVSLKIDRAVQAGAVAVLIGLSAPGPAISFSYGGGTQFAPSLVITQAESNTIKGALALPSTVNATISPANAIPPPFSTLCGPG
jgi:hypothetical protein